jgi:hypothetical protein
MNRLTAVALIIAGTAIPVCAQRAGSRGGFSGHSGQASRGGFSSSAPNRFASSPRYARSTSPFTARSLQRVGASGFGARPPYTGASRYRRPYLSPYGTRIPYVLPVGVSPYFMGYPDAFGYDDSSTSPDYAADGYDTQPVEQGQPAPPWPYGAANDRSHQSPAPGSEQAVTLFFKDGRPPEQVHNYILTRTTLYVGDGHHREIPTDELDLAATAELNQDAGVDFRLPNVPR